MDGKGKRRRYKMWIDIEMDTTDGEGDPTRITQPSIPINEDAEWADAGPDRDWETSHGNHDGLRSPC